MKARKVVWRLHVLAVPARILCGYSGFLSQSRAHVIRSFLIDLIKEHE